MSSVALLGTGPAADAVRAALAAHDVAVAGDDAASIPAAAAAVVCGVAGAEGFDRPNRVASDAGVPWLAVELGGVGGRPFDDVNAAVSGFGPDAGCFDCLRSRVAAAGGEDGDASPSVERSEAWFAGAVAGRAVVRRFDGESFAGRVVETPHTRRSFLPVEGCSVCGGERDRSLDREYADATLQDAVARAERAVDDRLGVVPAVGERESYPAPYYLATLCDTGGFSDASVPRQAAGVADGWDRAYVKALGEALERYSAGVYRADEFVEAHAADLDDAVHPEEFVRPDWGDASGPRPWLPGEDLPTGDAVSLPAELVQFPPPERSIRPAITTGLGLGSSTVDALVSGLTEVIERDATMLAWYSTFEPLGLSVDREAFDALARRARSEGLSVTPLLVTQDVDVPVVAVAVHREGDWPRFALGSAADLDAGAAAVDALAEALQNWMELRTLGPDDAADAGGAIGRYADFPEPVQGLVAVEDAVPADSVGPDEVSTGGAALEELLERVAAAGLDAYAARVTPRDVASLGFEAVRVLVPAAQPLFVDEPYFGERAREVPRDLGFEPRLDRAYHPYP